MTAAPLSADDREFGAWWSEFRIDAVTTLSPNDTAAACPDCHALVLKRVSLHGNTLLDHSRLCGVRKVDQ